MQIFETFDLKTVQELFSYKKKDNEIDETVDLVMMNLDTFEESTVLKATDQIEYFFEGWKNTQEFIYKKHDLIKDEDEELTFVVDERKS